MQVNASSPLTLTLSLREREPALNPIQWPRAVLFYKDGLGFSLSLGERAGVHCHLREHAKA